jgi:hypothetical protein
MIHNQIPGGWSLERLRSLCLVVDSGGVAGAIRSERLRGTNVAATQLHHQVRELESAFGPLVVRNRARHNRMVVDGNGRVACTAAGIRLLALARMTLKGLADIAQENLDGVLELSLGAGDSFLQWWAVGRLGHALESRRVALSLRALNLRQAADAVQDGLIDFAVSDSRTLQEMTRDGGILATRALGFMGYSLFVPKSLKAGNGRERPLDKLRRLPLALQHSERTVGDRVLELLGSGHGLRRGVECETFPQAAKAVLAGTHAAVLPDIARTELRRTNCDRVEISELRGLRREMCLAWNSEAATVSPRLGDAAEILANALRLPP